MSKSKSSAAAKAKVAKVAEDIIQDKFLECIPQIKIGFTAGLRIETIVIGDATLSVTMV